MTTIGTHLTRILLVVAALVACVGESQAQIRFRVAHLVNGVPAIDAYIQGGTTPYLEDVPYEGLSARSAGFSAATDVVITRANAGSGAALLSTTIPVDAGIYTLLAYGTSAAPKLSTLAWPFNPSPGVDLAAVRVFNASAIAGNLDVYFDSTMGAPAIEALRVDSVSTFQIRPAAASSLIITAAGSKTPIARFVLPLAIRSTQTLVITGTGTPDMAVHLFGDGTGPVDATSITALQREQAVGAAPTLRFVNALPQPDARRLDVFLNGSRNATGINYRSASGVLAGVGVGPIGVALVPENRTIVDSVYGTLMTLARDTAYALVLTQFKSGAIISLTLKRSFSAVAPAAGHAKIRVANVTDFHSSLTYQVTGANTLTIESPQFLTATNWQEVNAGPMNLQVFKPGVASPILQGTYEVPAGAFITLLAIGDDAKFTVDVLVHEDPGAQQPMATFGDPEVGVRDESTIAAHALRLKSVPNPFVDNARITFALAQASEVSLDVYDVMGRRIRTLATGWRAAGEHDVAIDDLVAGAYTVVLRAGGATATVGVIRY